MANQRMGKLVCVLSMCMLLPCTTFAATDLNSAFSEGKVSGSIRVYDWSKDIDNQPEAVDVRTTAVGGYAGFQTGQVSGFTGGFGFKTVQDITWADEHAGYFGLVDSQGESYTGLTEYYIRFSGKDTIATVGAQYLKTPYMNNKDFRMVPLAYRGGSITNRSIDKFEFNAGYFTDYMAWTDTEFKKMMVGDGGSFYGGVSYQPSRGLDANIWYYHFQDNYSIITPEFKWGKKLNKDWFTAIDIRTGQWSGVGDELIGDIDTYMLGFIGTLKWKNLGMDLCAQQNGDQKLLETFGNRRAVTMQVYNAERAEETAYSVKLEYGFSAGALKGTRAYVNYAIYDTPDPGEENFTQDMTELDFLLEYAFSDAVKALKFLKGTKLTLRYAIVDKDQDQRESKKASLQKNYEDLTDFRVYLRYDF